MCNKQLNPWLDAGGGPAIGSDSQVSVDVGEELRWLEYGQRLRSHQRTIAASPEALFVHTARWGGRALGRPTGTLAAGQRVDFVVLPATTRRWPAATAQRSSTAISSRAGARRCATSIAAACES